MLQSKSITATQFQYALSDKKMCLKTQFMVIYDIQSHFATHLATQVEQREDEARDDEDADGRPRRLRPGRLGTHLVRHAQPDQP